ncbi:MAG: GNAT family N-acetyltransferase [Bdellovibrionales bacterium]|jgi:RimJ/RimL family protein N-acetyltransferase|nr:GNAT family N-acetyltransferase [Bdellovibrionales bacterium]
MNWATEPLYVANDKITVRTITKNDIEDIVEAIHDPKGWSGRMWGIDTPEKIRDMLQKQIEGQVKGECHPMVYFVDGKVAGITRYHSLFPGRKALEIGGTCIAPNWRRSFVNTEVKNILLTYAFEKLRTVRVELRVDCLNYVSQMNVLRLGATFEGIIRHWQVRKNGDLPDGMLYSITNKDWPTVKERLIALQNRQKPKTPFLPWEIEHGDLQLKVSRLTDANDLLELTKRNKKSLIESFPQSACMESSEQAYSYIAERTHWAASGTAFYYGVRHKKNNQLIGQFHIKHINWKSLSAELGYFIDAGYRRQGIASQLIELAIEELFAKRNFRRITLRAITNNDPSIKLAEKLGFRREGILRAEFTTGTGEFVDTVLFSKLKSD